MLQVILFALQSDLRLCSELPGSGSRIKPPWERLGGGSGDWWKNQPFQKDTLWTKHHIMKQEANYKKHFEMNYISYISLYLVPARDMLNSTWNRTSNVLTQFCSTFFPRSFFSTKKTHLFLGPSHCLTPSTGLRVGWPETLGSLAGGLQQRQTPRSPNCNTSVQCCWYI